MPTQSLLKPPTHPPTHTFTQWSGALPCNKLYGGGCHTLECDIHALFALHKGQKPYKRKIDSFFY